MEVINELTLKSLTNAVLNLITSINYRIDYLAQVDYFKKLLEKKYEEEVENKFNLVDFLSLTESQVKMMMEIVYGKTYEDKFNKYRKIMADPSSDKIVLTDENQKELERFLFEIKEFYISIPKGKDEEIINREMKERISEVELANDIEGFLRMGVFTLDNTYREFLKKNIEISGKTIEEALTELEQDKSVDTADEMVPQVIGAALDIEPSTDLAPDKKEAALVSSWNDSDQEFFLLLVDYLNEGMVTSKLSSGDKKYAESIYLGIKRNRECLEEVLDEINLVEVKKYVLLLDMKYLIGEINTSFELEQEFFGTEKLDEYRQRDYANLIKSYNIHKTLNLSVIENDVLAAEKKLVYLAAPLEGRESYVEQDFKRLQGTSHESDIKKLLNDLTTGYADIKSTTPSPATVSSITYRVLKASDVQVSYILLNSDSYLVVGIELGGQNENDQSIKRININSPHIKNMIVDAHNIGGLDIILQENKEIRDSFESLLNGTIIEGTAQIPSSRIR